MDFDLTREQEMIRKEVRKFAQSEIAPVALELDEAEDFSEDLTRKMGEIGLFGMFVSEAYEGQAMDYISELYWIEKQIRQERSYIKRSEQGAGSIACVFECRLFHTRGYEVDECLVQFDGHVISLCWLVGCCWSYH